MTKIGFNVVGEIDESRAIRAIAIVSVALLINIYSVNDWAYDVNE